MTDIIEKLIRHPENYNLTTTDVESLISSLKNGYFKEIPVCNSTLSLFGDLDENQVIDAIDNDGVTYGLIDKVLEAQHKDYRAFYQLVEGINDSSFSSEEFTNYFANHLIIYEWQDVIKQNIIEFMDSPLFELFDEFGPEDYTFGLDLDVETSKKVLKRFVKEFVLYRKDMYDYSPEYLIDHMKLMSQNSPIVEILEEMDREDQEPALNLCCYPILRALKKIDNSEEIINWWKDLLVEEGLLTNSQYMISKIE